MNSPLAAHLLFVVLLIGLPAQSAAGIGALRAVPATAVDRGGLYATGIVAQVLLAATAAYAAGRAGLAWLTAAPGGANHPLLPLLIAATAAVGVWLLLPFVPSPWRAGQRRAVQDHLSGVAFLMPHTPGERRAWWAVSLAAGIGEEWVYRAFLWRYVGTVAAPLGIGPVGALAAASLVFGLAHVYQGAKAVLVTALLGFALGVVYAASGSLLLAMLLHALIDLRILLLWPPESGPDAVH